MATVRVDADVRFDGRKIERDVSKAFKRAEKGISLKLDDRSFRQPLGRITGDLSEFQKSLAASNARVVAFAASAGILYKLTQGFDFLLKTTIEVEKQLKDINVVLGASSGNLKKFGSDLFDIAANTGQTFKAAAEAATEFSRQGLGLEKTLRRTKDALVLARLSGMDTVEATNALTAAVNSFSSAALTTTQIVNKLATVDAAFAVSSTDLAEAIKRSGASAQAAGVSFDELLAIVTAVQERTARGGAVIGNSLKTIFTRVARPEVLNQLHKLGVEVENLHGDVLPAMKVLENFAQKFDGLSDATKATSAEMLGGVFQVNNLKAALMDLGSEYSRYKSAVEIAGKATQQATLRNEELNTTLSARLNKALQETSRLAATAGELTLKPAIDRTLDIINLGLPAPAEGEKYGKTIGEAVFRGIGTFLSGPGLAGAFFLIGKFAKDFLVFSKKVLVDLGMQSKKTREIKEAESSLRAIYTSNLSIVKQLQAGTISRADAEARITLALREQAGLMSTIRGASAAGAAGYVATTKALGGGRPGKASGHIPTASHGFVPAGAAMAEVAGAYAAGYTPGQVRSTNIAGIGKVVYNTREKIQKVPGMSQPAIIPPASSKGGQAYRKNFKKVHGFTPAAGGLTPDGFPKFDDFAEFEAIKRAEAAARVKRRMSRAARTASSAQAKIEAMTQMHGPGVFHSGDIMVQGARGGEVAASNTAKREINRVYQKLAKEAASNALSMEKEKKAREYLIGKYKISSSSMDLLSQTIEDELDKGKERQRAKSALDQAEASQKALTAQKWQTAGMIGAIAIPMIAGMAETAMRRREDTGANVLYNERMGSVVSGLGQIGGMASMGAVIGGGPVGAVVGAGLGAAMAVPDMISNFSTVLPELKKDFELLQEQLNQVTNATQSFEKSLMQMDQVFSGELQGDKAAQVMSNFLNSFGAVPTDALTKQQRKQFSQHIDTYIESGGTDEEALKGIRGMAAKVMERKAERMQMKGLDVAIESARTAGTLSSDQADVLIEQLMGTKHGGKTVQERMLDKFIRRSPADKTGKRDFDLEDGFDPGRVYTLSTVTGGSREATGKAGRLRDEDFFAALPSELRGRVLRAFGQQKAMYDREDGQQILEERERGARGFRTRAHENRFAGPNRLAGFHTGTGGGIMGTGNAPIIERALTKYIAMKFPAMARLRTMPITPGEGRMTRDDYLGELTGVAEAYDTYVEELATNLQLLKSALQIQTSQFSARADGVMQMAAGRMDDRAIARLKYDHAIARADMRRQQQKVPLTTQLAALGPQSRMKKFLQPYITGEKRVSMIMPSGSKDLQMQTIENIRKGFGATRGPGTDQPMPNIFDFAKMGEWAKTIKPGAGPVTGVGSPILTGRQRRQSFDDFLNALVESGKEGLTEADAIKKQKLELDKEELEVLRKYIAMEGERTAAGEEAGIRLVNQLNLIQQASEKAFAGGIAGFQNQSGVGTATQFGVNRMMMGMPGIGGRQKGLMALQNLDAFSEVARLLPEGAMTRDTLMQRGGGQLKSSLIQHYDTITKGMGMQFSQADLGRIAQSQIDQRFKPTDEDLAIPLAQNTNDILQSLHEQGFSIKNVDEVATKIYNAVKSAAAGNPNPSGRFQDVDEDGNVTFRTAAEIKEEERKGTAGIGKPKPYSSTAIGAQTPFLKNMGEGFFMRTNSFADGMQNMGNMMAEISNDLRTGFKGALREAMFSADSLSDALRTAAVNILDNLSSKVFDVAFDAMFNAMGTKLGFGAKGGYVTTRGIKGYAGGGLVRGGSGFRDDVPAMLSQGEFVIRKSAVDKYGAGNLNALNMQGGGGVSLNAPNTLIPNDPKRPTSFKYNISPRLSALAATDESRPDVARRRQAADAILRNNMQHTKAMQAYKAQQQGRLIQAYTSAAMMFASYGMVKGMGGFDKNLPVKPSHGSMYSSYLGGSVPGFASGGYVDNVPAMLMGGEMVMNRDAVNRHGRGFFEKINKGQAQGFREGGMVGGFAASPDTSSGGGSFDVIDRLIESNEALKSSIDESSFGKNSEKSGAAASPAASSANNNVTVNINIDKGGNAKSDAQASSNGNGNADSQRQEEEKAVAMSESIRTACLDVILNEKRPGGALSQHGIAGR